MSTIPNCLYDMLCLSFILCMHLFSAWQELSEHLGLRKLNERLTEPSMQDSFDGIFPKDNPKNTRFAINFFTSIGLGGLTDSLREYLKNMPRMIMNQHKPVESENEGAGSDDDSDTSGGGSSDSDSSSSESDSDSDTTSGSPEKSRKKRRKWHQFHWELLRWCGLKKILVNKCILKLVRDIRPSLFGCSICPSVLLQAWWSVHCWRDVWKVREVQIGSIDYWM